MIIFQNTSSNCHSNVLPCFLFFFSLLLHIERKTYIIFSYLTYNPPKVEFFFDPLEEKYGINTYVIR